MKIGVETSQHVDLRWLKLWNMGCLRWKMGSWQWKTWRFCWFCSLVFQPGKGYSPFISYWNPAMWFSHQEWQAIAIAKYRQVAISAQLVVSTCCILVAKGGSNLIPLGSPTGESGFLTRVAFARKTGDSARKCRSSISNQRPAASCCTLLPCTS